MTALVCDEADAREALQAAKLTLPADTLEVSFLHAGALGQSYLVPTDAGEVVLKVYPCDLPDRMRNDPDPRFSTMADFVPVPPFFSSSHERIERIRDAIEPELPRILAEGRFESGFHYTVMSKLEGHAFDESMLASPERRRELSRQLGELTAGLHSVRADEHESGTRIDTWLLACAESLHCAAEHLPAFLVGPARSRRRLHTRLHRILQRLGRTDLGPFVIAHCDLHPSNMLFDEDRIRALFDFQLSAPGPAAMDYRWLCLLDADVFLESYGRAPETEDEAGWLGHFFDMMWMALGLVSQTRHYEVALSGEFLIPHARQFSYLVGLLENDRLRRGPEWLRNAYARALLTRYTLRHRRNGAGPR